MRRSPSGPPPVPANGERHDCQTIKKLLPYLWAYKWRVLFALGCLLGANAGLGISLGDDCVIEAGLYVTAGTKVTTGDGQTVKARELSGANNLLFRRNSVTGAVEVVKRDGTGITLNDALHAN